MSVPTETERRQRIEQLIEAWKQAGGEDRETLSVPWQGERKVLPVIKLPLEFVLLSPHSHRIQSALESNPSSAEIVKKDPYSEAAQSVIASLLRSSPGYAELKANLNEEKQREAGIITRAGLLVNANRRAATLLELNPHGYVRVAVLPEVVSDKEIALVELKLQQQRDLKEDYTFPDQMLFVEDMKSRHGFSDEDLARELNWAASSDEKALREGVKQIRQFTRILGLVREVQIRSDGKVPTDFFNDKRQLLIDLDQRLDPLSKSDPEEADRVKEAGYVAVLTGAYYAPARQLAGDAIEDYFLPLLEDSPEGAAIADVVRTPPTKHKPVPEGVGDLLDEPVAKPADEPLSLRPLVDLLAKTHADDTVMIATDGTPTDVERADLVGRIRNAIDLTSESVKNEDRKSRNLEGPADLLKGAREKTERALDAYRAVATDRELKTGQVRYALKRLRQAVDAMEAEVERTGG